MHKLICQKLAHFLSAQMALVSTFFQIFYVLGMYNITSVSLKRMYRGWSPKFATTLESGIDVGQGINVGPGKFVKKNKCRA